LAICRITLEGQPLLRIFRDALRTRLLVTSLHQDSPQGLEGICEEMRIPVQREARSSVRTTEDTS
jgi:hypothetical protein